MAGELLSCWAIMLISLLFVVLVVVPAILGGLTARRESE